MRSSPLPLRTASLIQKEDINWDGRKEREQQKGENLGFDRNRPCSSSMSHDVSTNRLDLGTGKHCGPIHLCNNLIGNHYCYAKLHTNHITNSLKDIKTSCSALKQVNHTLVIFIHFKKWISQVNEAGIGLGAEIEMSAHPASGLSWSGNQKAH